MPNEFISIFFFKTDFSFEKHFFIYKKLLTFIKQKNEKERKRLDLNEKKIETSPFGIRDH